MTRIRLALDIVFVDPTHDLVVVWRWSAQSNEGFRRVVAVIRRVKFEFLAER